MRKKIIFIVLMVSNILMLHAVPAKRGLLSVKQPDGSTLTILLHGDECSHLKTSIDGYPLLEGDDGVFRYATISGATISVAENAPMAHNPKIRGTSEKNFVSSLEKVTNIPNYIVKSRKARSMVEGLKTGFPTTGKLRGLIILAEFQDAPFTYKKENFSRMMNTEGYSDYGGTGSARDYFISQSNGQFTPTFDVVGPVKLSRNLSYYGKNVSYSGSDQATTEMIEEACKLAVDSVDYSNYDNDGDGSVDMVFVVYAGYGENAGAPAYTIWPHKYDLSDAGINLTLDNKKIDIYACSCELNGNSGSEICGIGTFCHEFGHVLGLPDMYNTSNSENAQLGTWDIMDYGPYNNDGRTPPSYSAFERYSLGWLEPIELTDPQETVELGEINETQKAYRLSTSDDNEFFLLENHQQEGWDKYQGGKGMLITHIDYNKSAWTSNTVNVDDTHQRVKLLAADNAVDFNNGVNGDPFPGSTNNTAFTDLTTPSSVTWDGSNLNKWVTNIADNDGLITFDFMNNYLMSPVAVDALDINNSGFTAKWESVKDANEYTLYIYKHILSTQTKKALDEDFSLMASGSVSSPNAVDISSSLDNYTSTSGWTGSQVYQAGGYCKLGSTGVSGSITTPSLDLTTKNNVYTIVFTVQSYSGLTPYFQVTSGNETVKHKINSGAKTYLCVFNNGSAQSQITFASLKERAYIDDIHIIRGNALSDYPSATILTTYTGSSSMKKAEAVNDDYVDEKFMEITGLKGSSYIVNNLDMSISYSYRVQAFSYENNNKSILSNLIIVDGTTGLSKVKSDSVSIRTKDGILYIEGCTKGANIILYSVDGTIVKQYPVSRSDTSLQIVLPHKGLYIVKVGNYVKKIII